MSRPEGFEFPTFETQDGGKALQELYRWIDGSDGGTSRIAWYGQLRAEGYDHAKAMVMTIDQFELYHRDWWAVRELQYKESLERLAYVESLVEDLARNRREAKSS